LKSSYGIAGLMALAAAFWIASGQFGQSNNLPASQKPPVVLAKANSAPTVRVRIARAEPRTGEEILRGRTEADRMVDIKSETYGRIATLEADRGIRVAKGHVLVELSTEERPARLREAKALLAQRQVEFDAATKLSAKGYRGGIQVAIAKAELEAAQARVRVAETALGDTIIKAPFDGTIDDHMVELGDFVEQGDVIARIVDLDPILVVAQVNERLVGQLQVGQTAQVDLITGQSVTGHLRFISSVADPATRTFRIELEAENPGEDIADGVTAELRIPTGRHLAYHVSPAILTLSQLGDVGIKAVDEEGRVVFLPVRIMGSDEQGVWLSGLPPDLVMITVGQEFVKVGQKVRPIDEESLEPLAGADPS